MAILKQRLNRKNDNGTYDTIYLETVATVIKMSDTDNTLLSSKIASMDTAINGKQPAGSYAAASHNHSTANITSGTLAVAHGGTGQTTLDTAVGTASARAIYAGTGAMVSGTTALTTGRIYLQYS